MGAANEAVARSRGKQAVVAVGRKRRPRSATRRRHHKVVKRAKRLPPSPVQRAVARYLQKARAKAKESQRVWGKRFGWSRAFIAILENGRAALGLRAMTHVARRLHLKPSVLLKRAGV